MVQSAFGQQKQVSVCRWFAIIPDLPCLDAICGTCTKAAKLIRTCFGSTARLWIDFSPHQSSSDEQQHHFRRNVTQAFLRRWYVSSGRGKRIISWKRLKSGDLSRFGILYIVITVKYPHIRPIERKKTSFWKNKRAEGRLKYSETFCPIFLFTSIPLQGWSGCGAGRCSVPWPHRLIRKSSSDWPCRCQRIPSALFRDIHRYRRTPAWREGWCRSQCCWYYQIHTLKIDAGWWKWRRAAVSGIGTYWKK